MANRMRDDANRMRDEIISAFDGGLERAGDALNGRLDQGKEALYEAGKVVGTTGRRARKAVEEGGEYLTDTGSDVAGKISAAFSNRPIVSTGIALAAVWAAWTLFKR